MGRLLILIFLLASAFAQSNAELEILSRTNQFRMENGRQPLQWDDLAAKAALGHANDMLNRNYFAHQNPEGLGAGERMQAVGVIEVTTGENLATFENYQDSTIARASVDGWIKSPGHRANLLEPEFTHLGVSIVRKGNRVMAVQNFLGRPFNPRAVVSPVVAQRYVLQIKGSAPGTLGVFIGNGLYTKLNPTFDAQIEIPPQSKISYALYDGKTWWTVQPGQRGVQVQGGISASQVQGKQISLNLPAGQYTLALGKQPRFWQNISGPTKLDLVLAETLEVLWIGKREGGSIQYTHRIGIR